MLSCSTQALRRLLLALVLVLVGAPIAHSQEEKAEDPPEAKAPPAPPSGVALDLSRSMYAPGDLAEVTVNNNRKDSVFLAGCGSYQIELFEAETYSPLPGEHCVSEGEAIEVPPGTHTLAYTPGPELSGKILRVSVSFGWGCEAGRELSQARCADFATVSSTSFRVSKKGK